MLRNASRRHRGLRDPGQHHVFTTTTCMPTLHLTTPLRSRDSAGESDAGDGISYRAQSEDLPYADETFDHIDAADWIERLRWQRWAFQEAVRTLKVGGTFTVRFIDRRSCRGLWRRLSARAVGFLDSFRRISSRESLVPMRLVSSRQLVNWGDSMGMEALPAGNAGPSSGPTPRTSITPFQSAVHFIKRFRHMQATHETPSALALLEKDAHAFFANWGDRRPTAARTNAEELVPTAADGPVLALAPHPDDELIGCGGTLLKYVGLGVPTHVVFMTPGATCLPLRGASPETRRNVRYREAQNVAMAAGFIPHFWNSPGDGELTLDQSEVLRLRDTLNDVRPRLIFVPTKNDLHPEHRITNRLLAAAMRLAGLEARRLEYPVWGSTAYNRFVDVNDVHTLQMSLLLRYRTAMRAADYCVHCTLVQALNAVAVSHAGYVETFNELP